MRLHPFVQGGEVLERLVWSMDDALPLGPQEGRLLGVLRDDLLVDHGGYLPGSISNGSLEVRRGHLATPAN